DHVEFGLGEHWQDRALQTDHRADERVDDDEQRELRGVLAQAQTDRRTAVQNRGRSHVPAPASSCPRLKARTRSISAGLGGTSETASMNPCLSSDSIEFQRFSNASVLVGFPLRPAPHTEPEK